MKRIGYGIISFLILAGLGPQVLLARRKAPTAAELMARARKLIEIRAPGSPPFQLKGNVTLFGTAAGTVKGTYTLLWMSPEKWRETMSFPGYTQVRMLLGHKMWRYRSSPRIPLQVFRMQHSLGYTFWPTLKRHHKAPKVRARKNGVIREWCFETRHHDKASRLCFDATSGVLLTYGGTSCQFAHYEPWGSKLSPRKVTVFIDNNPAAEFRAVQLSSLGHLGPATFTPPSGSTESPGCQDPTDPKVLAKRAPTYPDSARVERLAGTVRVLGEVGVDGKLHHTFVQMSPGKIFDTAVLHALRRWKFRPASCKGTPVPVEIEIDVDFKLRH